MVSREAEVIEGTKAVAPSWTEEDLSGSVTERFIRVAAALPGHPAVSDTS